MKITLQTPIDCLRLSALVSGCLFSLSSAGEVTASKAWARATVPAQKTTAAYLTLHSTGPARILEVRSSVAGRAEIHATEMKGGVMHMHAMDDLAIAPGKSLELKPGGNHVMLMELKKPLKPGDGVPLTILVDEGGKRSTVEVTAEVRGIGR